MTAPVATRSAIERKGIEWVAGDERSGNPRRHFWLWTAANLNPFVIATGLLVLELGLSWWKAIIAIVVGVAVGYPLVGLMALAGLRGGAPTLTLSRATFGYDGNKIPALLAYLACVGWEAIALFLSASATETLIDRVVPGIDRNLLLGAGLAVTGVITAVIALYGYHLIMRAQKWITLAMTVAIIGYGVLVVRKLGLPDHPPAHGDGPLLAGISFVIAGGGLAWVMAGADYSRYLPSTVSPRGVVGWTTLGGATAPIMLMLFGVFAGTASPELAARAAQDPLGALTVPLPTWFCVPFLLTMILGLVGSGVVNLYSSGLNLLALGVKLPRPRTILVDATLVVLASGYLIFLSPSFLATFETFLGFLGVPLAAWCAIFLADFYFRHRAGYAPAALYPVDRRRMDIEPAAATALAAAALLGLSLDRIFDATRPGILVAFVVGGILYAGLVFRTRRS
ncbi:purine-cytosine permease family protein [Nocardia sp. NPDC051570]|uniref:purine-cytosine permease family protein n=1 Tax=Nocardia sp. NPDC051570 TaxID=3364324 RepID=UPI00379F0742